MTRRPWVLGLAACTAAGALVAVPASPALADDTATIGSPELSVAVGREFPRIVSYAHTPTGAVVHGRSTPLDTVLINGTALKPVITAEFGADARYHLAFPQGVSMDARISVEGATVTFAVTAIDDTDALRVNTIAIPGQDLVSVRSTDTAAQIAAARLDIDASRVGDTIYPVTAATAPDASPIGANYVLAAANGAAVAIETNSVYDKPTGTNAAANGRVMRQARSRDGYREVGLWSGEWTYRGAGASATDTEPLPLVRIALTGDANADAAVDWQDAAIALRPLQPAITGAANTPYRVVPRIPFNIASLATHPFGKTLDDTKRIALATDGLGQFVLLKGYQSEGHDAAHADYGGNYNTRAGGLGELNTLLEEGRAYNAEFGVHVNATEAYPEAHSFSEQMVDPSAKGWAWMDQSYYIDQRRDLTTGAVMDRFDQLFAETNHNLSFVYIDVYYSQGWLADSLSRRLNEAGVAVASEWSHRLPSNQIWSHWANDPDYGPDSSRGVSSHILRFIGNDAKDVFVQHPLLGGSRMSDFEGWTGEVDFNAFLANVFTYNVPTKYLQRSPVTRWAEHEIGFADGSRVSDADGVRRITAPYGEVAAGDAYLLPWPDGSGGTKLYHYNKTGGTTTFAVPPGLTTATLYKLSDTGRKDAVQVPVVDGKVTLTAEAGVPYVLYSHEVAATSVTYGTGTPVADPGFNAGTFGPAWTTRGEATVERNARGQYEAIAGDGRTSIAQKIGGLAPGTYVASANIEIEPGKEREATISVTSGHKTAANGIERSSLRNNNNSDEKVGTNSQRVRVYFDVTAGKPVTLTLGAGRGSARVTFDDVRVVPGVRPAAGSTWDFEHVDQGWGPFYRGGEKDAGDANTHLSELHAPYTQAGWNGKVIDDVLAGQWSLKSFEYDDKLAYRTTPATVAFKAGHRYRVAFSYENELAGAYGWVLGVDGPGGTRDLSVTPFPQATTPTAHVQEFTAGKCGDYWVGLRRLPPNSDQVEFALDDFTVVDLGPAPAEGNCGAVSIAAKDAKLTPGKANEVTTTFVNGEPGTVRDVSLALAVPTGWTATASGTTARRLDSGESLTVKWAVTPPADAADIGHALTGTVAYRAHGRQTVTGTSVVRTLPPPPSGVVYASDHTWISATGGWGPVERDRANGGQGKGDGPPLTLNGVAYPKGLGTHAPSEVVYFLGGRCSTFTASVGVDDAQPTRGTIRFHVYDGDRELAVSPLMRADSATFALTASLTGVEYLRLVVDDGGDGNGNDHADWADAKFAC
ncbi:hypothetical protein Afil01_11610 [Actinorhabdospora filicis]|uniref:Glycosyl hydrolase family 98 putative carbohydrate-binding module domain-containing protein n=1 Tax=Actinorhabdospora filicis TaxID=1785913 RepID=A0A9W6W7A4_9ACTN|nr:endo-alpha-N-acetylgalactosaminidase family protein [Actinorhabdospora filicis]GLZ76354.1 hypothetical protein Afil01_11610 [Actinorhabdospora filicis]